MAHNFLLISAFILTTCFLVGSSFARKSDCPESCTQRVDVGMSICPAWLDRWFFNSTSAKCQRFLYNGCGGNANNFYSRQECNEKCSPCKEESTLSKSGNEHAKCDCNYERAKSSKSNKIGGCRISVPAPEGWKCQCTHKAWRWGCSGTAQKCRDGESCPKNCTSKKCCNNGGGNCGGYDSGSQSNLRQNYVFDYNCGPNFNGKACSGGYTGMCCSAYGYCGMGPNYCGGSAPECATIVCGLGLPCCQGRCVSMGPQGYICA